MSRNKKSPDDIRRAANTKKIKLTQTMGLLQETLKNYFKELESLMTQSTISSVKIEMFRQKIEHMENQIADSKTYNYCDLLCYNMLIITFQANSRGRRNSQLCNR